MRVVVTSLLLAISAGAALAQTGSITPATARHSRAQRATPAKSAPAAPGQGRPHRQERRRGCQGRVHEDVGFGHAHEPAEWSSTCDRIQTRLDNLKVENLDVMGTGVRKKTGAGKQGSVDLKTGPN